MIDGVSQCSINPKINPAFAETIHQTERQDPDLIVIDEITDSRYCKHGYGLMKTWNLPESYCQIVRLHHAADLCGEKGLLPIVCLADRTGNKVGIGLRISYRMRV